MGNLKMKMGLRIFFSFLTLFGFLTLSSELRADPNDGRQDEMQALRIVVAGPLKAYISPTEIAVGNWKTETYLFTLRIKQPLKNVWFEKGRLVVETLAGGLQFYSGETGAFLYQDNAFEVSLRVSRSIIDQMYGNAHVCRDLFSPPLTFSYK